MATPLALLALASFIATAASSAQTPSAAGTARCPINLYEWYTEDGVTKVRNLPLAASAVECVEVLKILPDFLKLREKAGFDESSVSLVLKKETSRNAYYRKPFILLNTGILLELLPPSTLRWTLAHELGHAIQREGPEWSESVSMSARMDELKARNSVKPEDTEAWLAFNRRYEAQADGIAQQLLSAAGYPAGVYRRGTENFFSCSSETANATTHPAAGSRLVNASLGRDLLNKKNALTDATTAARAFDGTGLLTQGAAPAAQGRVPAVFQPIARMSDYDDSGRLLPGRLATKDLRIPVPPPASGRIRETLQLTAASFVDFWIADPFQAAVNHIARDRAVAQAVLTACGTPKAEELSADFGVTGWTKRIALDAVRRVIDWF